MKWEMLHLLLLGLDEIHSGKITVKWDLIYGDVEMSWRLLHPDGSSLPKERKRLLALCGRKVWRDVALVLTIGGETVNRGVCGGCVCGVVCEVFYYRTALGQMVLTRQNTEG